MCFGNRGFSVAPKRRGEGKMQTLVGSGVTLFVLFWFFSPAVGWSSTVYGNMFPRQKGAQQLVL